MPARRKRPQPQKPRRNQHGDYIPPTMTAAAQAAYQKSLERFDPTGYSL